MRASPGLVQTLQSCARVSACRAHRTGRSVILELQDRVLECQHSPDRRVRSLREPARPVRREHHRKRSMDFIFMLTRHDRTIDYAEDIVDSVCELGVRHIGFKDIGVPLETLRRVVDRIRAHRATCYLEVVSTTSEAVASSLATGAALGVDRILGGTDVAAAERALPSLDRYFPFPG